MAKDINLTSEKWIDLIFEGRNKNYGAYTLRKNSPKRHTFAFLVVLAAAALIVMASVGISSTLILAMGFTNSVLENILVLAIFLMIHLEALVKTLTG